MTQHYDARRPAGRSLSAHQRFASWSDSLPWTHGSIAFGSVIGNLVDGIRGFVSDPRPNREVYWCEPVAIGCVPWMNNERLVAALTLLPTCIVMTKNATDLRGAHELQATGTPLPSAYLPGFDSVGFLDHRGQRPVMTPHGLTGPKLEELGPVRLAGWRGDRAVPLLHAKMLVLADAHWWETDWGEERWDLQVRRAWLGSANWTHAAENDHLEFGLWVDDLMLVEQVSKFLLDLLMFSEPLDTASDQPSPELADAEWDHAAFYEAMEAMRDYDDTAEREA
jgi:hypothetical protein